MQYWKAYLLGTLAWCIASVAVAGLLPSYCLRDLALAEGTLVTARLASGWPRNTEDAKRLGDSFAVGEVLRGDQSLAGSVLTITNASWFSLSAEYTREPHMVQPDQLLLLLRKDRENEWRLSYVYAKTKAGGLVRADQPMNPGGYAITQRVNITWEEAIQRLKRFLPQVDDAMALWKVTDTAERNRRIFEWLRRHEHELQDPSLCIDASGFHEPESGWGLLPARMLEKVAESGLLQDVWLAMQMSADVDPYVGSGIGHINTQPSPFACAEGRSLLLRKLCDENETLVVRRTAADQLAKALKVDPAQLKTNPQLSSVSLPEQEDILRGALPLASCKDRQLRCEVLMLLLCASDPFHDASRPQYSKRAFTTASTALQNEEEREVIADVVPNLNYRMSEAEWQALTGNPARICVVLTGSYDQGSLHLRADSMHLPNGAISPVELILERRDPDGKTVERLNKKLSSTYSQHWLKDAKGTTQLGNVNTTQMTPGRWWTWLEGVSADDSRQHWKSWHTCFDVQ